MPTLNIDVNARVEKAKKDLRALDSEVIKISKSEAILEKELKKVGDTGPKAFRKIQSAAVKQAKAVNSAALQFKQLRAQMNRLGSHPAAIGKLTSEFIRFRKEMERGVVGTTKFQKAQDRLKTVMGTTKRQLASTTAAVAKSGKAAVKGGKSFTGLGKTLENLGSTAVLVLGPLSGVGSRLIAFGAIAKRGSVVAAGFFAGIAGGGVLISKALVSFDKLNLSLSKTKAILKATGKEAQITAKFVEEAAASVARKTLANLEDTRPGATALLSFKGINADNLERVLTASQDTAALGLTDFTNALKLLGRASEDPIKNLDSLRRVGIQLTLTEKDQITTLQNMGKGVEAFNAILAIFEKKVGGLGEAENEGLEGAFDRLGQAWTHLLEDMGAGTSHELAVKAVNSLADALERYRVLRKEFKDIASDLGGSFKSIASDLGDSIESISSDFKSHVENIDSGFESKVKNIGSSIKDKLSEIGEEAGKMWESIDEMGKGEGEGFGSTIVVKILKGLKGGTEVVASGLKSSTEAIASDFEDSLVASGLEFLATAHTAAGENIEKFHGPDAPKKYLNILKPKQEPKSKPSTGSPTFVPPSHFNKALIDVNTSLRRSIMDLDAEREKLQTGFILMSPSILKLAERHKVLDEAVNALKGDFRGLGKEGRKTADLVRETNKALQDFDNKKKAATIFEQTRPALEKYNQELRDLIFLYDNSYISLSNLIVKQKELRATLESSTPELNALTSASEKFGDSLTDLMIKGEGFAAGLKSIFKSLVDDILKQFLKLAVINPIMNSIFGASANRPELGSQGGGRLGLGGAGGWLGKITGNDNEPKGTLGGSAGDFEGIGAEGAKDYGKALDKTNVKMEQVGAEGAVNFGSVFSGIASGIASAAGGAIGSFLGHKFADLLGFQHGGSFKVGGSGGRDSQLVAFKASPRERVSVETPEQQSRRSEGNVTYIDARGVDPGQMNRLIQVVKDLDESVEIRAVNATADARSRNPSLFGRIS